MARLVIVRHGTAVMGLDNDAARTLTEEGRAQADLAGQWLTQCVLGVEASIVMSSPYLRAQETAEAISRHSKSVIQTSTLLRPDSDPLALADILTGEFDNLIVVSHLPLVGRLAAVMVDGEVYDQPWSTAECWVLEGDLIARGCMRVSKTWYPGLEF